MSLCPLKSSSDDPLHDLVINSTFFFFSSNPNLAAAETMILRWLYSLVSESVRWISVNDDGGCDKEDFAASNVIALDPYATATCSAK